MGMFLFAIAPFVIGAGAVWLAYGVATGRINILGQMGRDIEEDLKRQRIWLDEARKDLEERKQRLR